LDLFREWFHFTESDKQSYYPDALIPVAQPTNRNYPIWTIVSRSNCPGFWVDLWVPAVAGNLSRACRCGTAGTTSALPIELVLPA
jgi:hypothetical protein